jgi:hypothetical protein
MSGTKCVTFDTMCNENVENFFFSKMLNISKISKVTTIEMHFVASTPLHKPITSLFFFRFVNKKL